MLINNKFTYSLMDLTSLKVGGVIAYYLAKWLGKWDKTLAKR